MLKSTRGSRGRGAHEKEASETLSPALGPDDSRSGVASRSRLRPTRYACDKLQGLGVMFGSFANDSVIWSRQGRPQAGPGPLSLASFHSARY